MLLACLEHSLEVHFSKCVKHHQLFTLDLIRGVKRASLQLEPHLWEEKKSQGTRPGEKGGRGRWLCWYRQIPCAISRHCERVRYHDRAPYCHRATVQAVCTGCFSSDTREIVVVHAINPRFVDRGIHRLWHTAASDQVSEPLATTWQHWSTCSNWISGLPELFQMEHRWCHQIPWWWSDHTDALVIQFFLHFHGLFSWKAILASHRPQVMFYPSETPCSAFSLNAVGLLKHYKGSCCWFPEFDTEFDVCSLLHFLYSNRSVSRAQQKKERKKGH